MTTHALEQYVRRRNRAADLVDGIAAVLDEIAVPGATLPSAHLRSTASRVREGRFVVLLLGSFSTGKSTLLNALLGEPVLPVKVNPCTAILTELVFAESTQAEIRYVDGRSQRIGLDALLDRFQLRNTSEREAGAEVSDRFGDVDRAVVGTPLPLLANGVALLDTPGLDDDPIRTARTLSSLPDADAVIVVLSAHRFLTDLERRTLHRDLLPLGLRNLFYPITMVDLLDQLADDPDKALADVRRRAAEVLGPDAPIFPLDARAALRARWDRAASMPRDPPDDALLASSGLDAFEDALERFLVDERGQAQLTHLHRTALRVRDDLLRQAELDRRTAEDSVEQLRRRQEELEPAFKELAAIARRAGRTTDAFVSRQQALVWQDLRDFMTKTEAALPDAVDEFDLGNLAGFDLLTSRGRAKVESELGRQLEAWLEARVAAWQASLRPKIEHALNDLQRDLAADAADFDAIANTIVTDFAGGSFALPGMGPTGERMDPVERWFSVALGAVLLSPGAMAAGWSEGYEGALKGAASRLGIRLALVTLGALLGPIGWAGLLLYVVSDAALLVLTGGRQLDRLRDQVAARLTGQLVAQADAARDEIATRVAEAFRPLREGLVGAAEAEAKELESLLERTITAREQAAQDATARVSRWTDALTRVQHATDELAIVSGPTQG